MEPEWVLFSLGFSEDPDPMVATFVVGTAIAEDIIEAASVIEDAGFTTCDDLTHGYGGGYFPPIMGSKSRPNEPIPNFTFEKNHMLVIQPNVITPDRKAGVQTGECVVITEAGCQSLHEAPSGLLRVGK